MIKYIGRIIKMSINKENLQKQIEEMKVKLADMEAELKKPDVVVNYWQPTECERYYYVNYLGLVGSASYAPNYHQDKVRYRVFKTEAEAQKYAEYVKAEETLRKVIAEANAGWIPDWNTFRDIKYVVVLNATKLEVFSYNRAKYLPNCMYIKNSSLAEKLMKDYEKEFITYLSY